MLKLSGIAPEDLPAVESIRRAEKRLKIDSRQTPPAIAVAEASEREALQEAPSEDRRPINLRTDLWKYALLVMATRVDGVISTSDLVAESPNCIQAPDDGQEALKGWNDVTFSQLVRNPKSPKTFRTNFIYQGFAEELNGGFRITEKGREFVKTHFSG